MDFDLHVGIDYSGARTPESPLRGLQVYADGVDQVIRKVSPPRSSRERVKHWSRQAIARWLVDLPGSGRRFIAGIDHCFSFPRSYFLRHDLQSWEAFLDDFVLHWPTHSPGTTVQELLQNSPERIGERGELRLGERWTQGARSVFVFQGTGSVGKSSFAGLAWLHFIRRQAGQHIHFWPFDGWHFPDDRSVVMEAYPAICKRRYPQDGRTSDEHDAYAVAAWLRDMDSRGALGRYSHPPLTEAEKRVAQLEGWIFGAV